MPEQLQEMIEKALEERKNKFTAKRNIKIKVVPEFKEMFNDTKQISRM